MNSNELKVSLCDEISTHPCRQVYKYLEREVRIKMLDRGLTNLSFRSAIDIDFREEIEIKLVDLIGHRIQDQVEDKVRKYDFI